MSGILENLKRNYLSHMKRQKNRPFLEGTMAACAMVATADGEVSFAERVRVDQILQSLNQLQVFDPHEGINIFNEYTDMILEHPATGHETTFLAMDRVARDPENGALMLRICVAICEADSGDHLADQIEIVSLCSRLGLDPTELGLYVDKSAEQIANSDKS
ncbi:MAG: tellurite resistance TerB family protein [Rhodospirillales bacterium]|nr:tellurite resistance TerB family protein [Rhodospirillales bacterium]